MRIDLDEREWQAVLAVLAQAPWGQVNGLILRIGEQMRVQSQQQPQGRANGDGRLSDDAETPERPQRAS